MTDRLPAQERKQQVLDAACIIFAQRGFHATSMEEIANSIGVTKPVLYQHFSSKRALFIELLEDVGQQLLNELGKATGSADSQRARVESGFNAYFRFVTGNEAAFRLLFGAAVRNDPDFNLAAQKILDEVADAIADLIEIPGSTGHRRVLAHGLIGIAEATSRDALTDDGNTLDPAVLANWVAELAWFGLRGVRANESEQNQQLN